MPFTAWKQEERNRDRDRDRDRKTYLLWKNLFTMTSGGFVIVVTNNSLNDSSIL